jgi:pyruvate dehydrogenase E2 component (dihydrolipoamide acetyltransferase)
MAERVFTLPDLGEGLEDAEIIAWKVAEGDRIELNQVLVEVNTAKAVVEIPSPYAGVIERLHAAPGDVVAVGRPLVTFRVKEAGERQEVLVGYGPDANERVRRRVRLRPPGATDSRETPPQTVAPTGPGERAPAALPLVRKLARDLGVDVATVEGSGPGGRITREDVLAAGGRSEDLAVSAAAGEGPAGPTSEQPSRPATFDSRATGEDRRVPVRGVRRLIARKMSQAWDEVPHAGGFLHIDGTELQAFRTWINSERPDARVSPLVVIARALAEVCKEHPKLNAWYEEEDEEIVLKGRCHIGIATDTERGLLVPVVRDVGMKGILTLAGEMEAVVSAAREGRASPEQLTGSTITITNVGTLGLDFGTPIVNFPEVAILSVGAIRPRPVVIDGKVAARPVFIASFSIDHRALDGADSARALVALRDLLEDGDRLRTLLLT